MTEALHAKRSVVLAFHPSARGVGWVAFESALSPLDWAVIRSNKNAKCLARIRRLIDLYHPDTVVFEAFEHGRTRRVDRVQRLCRAVVHLAASRAIATPIYSRAAIRTCFASVGAVTRYEIAEAIAIQIEAFESWLPPKRRAFMDQDARLGLFNAAAVGLTHFAVTGGAH